MITQDEARQALALSQFASKVLMALTVHPAGLNIQSLCVVTGLSYKPVRRAIDELKGVGLIKPGYSDSREQVYIRA